MRVLQRPNGVGASSGGRVVRGRAVLQRGCHHQRPGRSAVIATPPLPLFSRRAVAAAAPAAATTTTAEAPTAAVPAPAAAGGLQRDASAVEALMQAATEFALRRRLREHASVAVTVRCAPGNGILEGRFNAMAIEGTAWRTPLGMTARRLAVDIGPLQVDYGALVATRKVALCGARPRGATTITLTAADLGAFMTHPLFGRAAASAVGGKAFAFDPHSVSIRAPRGGGGGDGDGGEVMFEGVWAGDGRRYRVIMLPGGSGSSGSGAGKKLRVGAQLVTDANGSSSGTSGSSGNGIDSGGGSAPAVAAGIAQFFTHLAVDLDGIELSRPALALRPWGGGGSSGNGNGGNGSGSGTGGGGVLDIRMAVRIRAFPPLDMQF